jgi:purine-cytosine permease-like protein
MRIIIVVVGIDFVEILRRATHLFLFLLLHWLLFLHTIDDLKNSRAERATCLLLVKQQVNNNNNNK